MSDILCILYLSLRTTQSTSTEFVELITQKLAKRINESFFIIKCEYVGESIATLRQAKQVDELLQLVAMSQTTEVHSGSSRWYRKDQNTWNI